MRTKEENLKKKREKGETRVVIERQQVKRRLGKRRNKK